jgi:glycosyltransferase involved in cell wall biosynthesis
MEDVVLESGIDPPKVHRIPLGINLTHFPMRTVASHRNARLELGLPPDATVIGSFQKDGEGWGDGDRPKLIKGPDVLLAVLEQLKDDVPNLWVLLSGAARGFVRRGLERLGIPYVYRWVSNYSDIGSLYHASDLVLVTSREEGGPKAVLESMATGVPLVSTRVGQAPDLVQDGVNGRLTGVGDVPALASAARDLLHASPASRTQLQHAARLTAEANSYERQLPLWRSFFTC